MAPMENFSAGIYLTKIEKALELSVGCVSPTSGSDTGACSTAWDVLGSDSTQNLTYPDGASAVSLRHTWPAASITSILRRSRPNAASSARPPLPCHFRFRGPSS